MATVSFKQFSGGQPVTVVGNETSDDFKKAALQSKSSYLGDVGAAFQAGVGKIGEGINEAKPGGKGIEDLVSGVGKIVGGTTEAITSPIAPVMNASVGKAINAVGNKIADIPAVQKFATSPVGEKTAKVAETVANYAEGAGLVAGGVEAPKIPGAAASVISKIPKPEIGETLTHAKNVVSDVVPSTQRLINHQVAEAMDFTPGDLNKLSQSTGNDVGTWLSDNNLIKGNKQETKMAINDLVNKSHFDVRAELAKVQKVYPPKNVPRYTDALKVMQGKIKDTPGLEQVSTQIDKLLHKKEVTLSDVQVVKELLDDHYDLYNALGDVKSGIEKSGVANIRNTLKTFLEDEVKKAGGKDIEKLNNNVSTGKGIVGAIETRESAGLTRSNVTRADIPLGFFALTNPLVGIPLLFFKKAYETPTVRLKLARFLDSISDARKAKIETQLQSGVVPKELEDVTGLSSDPKALKSQK